MKKKATTKGESPSRLIDARIKELDDWRGKTLSHVRTLIKQADPEVVEEWKWRGVPVWSHDGLICTGETYKSVVKLTFAKGASCVDGPRPARDFVARGVVVACSHVSGPLVQPGWTAGPDGFREPRPHHSSGIDVPMKRQVSLDCVGSTDCAITLHCLSQALARSLAVYAAAAIRW
jgi:hypothetical protein